MKTNKINQLAADLAAALKPFAQFNCKSENKNCNCFNCKAQNVLGEYEDFLKLELICAGRAKSN